jgi:hypothetical protein
MMSSTPTLPDPRQRIVELLDQAEWDYDEEIDEMELVFPGSAGREGIAMLASDELYVRVDADTYEPLRIIIPGYAAWLAKQPPIPTVGPAAEPRRWLDIPRQTAQHAIRETVRASRELAAAQP